jgi:hypothetical protein
MGLSSKLCEGLKMKTYRVIASYVVEVYCDIEAESKDDAWDKAYHIDGGDYKPTNNDGDWQIDRIEEITQ